MKDACKRLAWAVLFVLLTFVSMSVVAGVEILLVNGILILAHSRAECLQTDNRWVWIALALVLFQLVYTVALYALLQYLIPRFENPFRLSTTETYAPLA
jgi:hypothetical protein